MSTPYVASRDDVTDALALIAIFGAAAAFEAQARADRSRDIGNCIHFCRWRQIERLIGVLGSDRAVGAVH
jgi:hypothetical protein